MPTIDQSKPLLDPSRRKELRAIGHGLKPVVTVGGEGVSAGVLAELNRALDDHELIKIKLAVGDRKLKLTCIDELCEKSGAILVQTVGNMALVLRENKKTKKHLSNLRRNISAK